MALGSSRERGYNAQDNPPLVPHPSPAEEKVVVVPKQKAMPEYADLRSQAKESLDKNRAVVILPKASGRS